ncbi:DNA repair protein RadC [Pantoea sp. 1.19]|uniref:RadC family protein n=1 Tax=Pantoea sp. 1.19 TaxID=1925589 RepID=UPI000948AE75|nr:DNA repair protein RadC [Pantoea sp. 1.19]
MNGPLPREKLALFGAAALTDAELLAIFLRTGTRRRPVLQLAAALLDRYGSLHQLMQEEELQGLRLSGIGPAKRAQLQAVTELSRRILETRLSRHGALQSPQSTYRYLQQLLHGEPREVFVVVYLDNQHRMIACEPLFRGSLRSVEVHPREIVRACLRHNAAALILAHNHPSGVAEPSRADRDITQRTVEACALIGVRVLDHVIVGRGCYVSFCERGWL